MLSERNDIQEIGENNDWFLLSSRMRKDRALKLRAYAKQHFEPVLDKFPELKGEVHLALRKEGWYAHYKPVLHIIVRAEDLEKSSIWRIRSITAHELLHLLQYLNGIGVNEHWNKTVERQATFLTFARGFAYEFLKAFPAECTRDECDHKFVFLYFRCDKIFKGSCKDLDEASFQTMARKLETLAQQYDTWERYDFAKLVSDCLVGSG